MKKIAIIGAGISGLFIANLFKKNSDYQVVVYEKNNSINLEEGYGIQLSVNSVKLLNQIGFSKFQNDKKFNPDKINFYSNHVSSRKTLGWACRVSENAQDWLSETLNCLSYAFKMWKLRFSIFSDLLQ